MEKKQKIIIIAIIFALVVLCSGLTYAYFTSAVNSESGSTIIAKGGTMNVIYDNGSGDIVMENIYPREKEWVTKKFTVTGNNTTDLNMYYRVSMVIDNNEYNPNDLSYTLTSENTSNNGEIIPSVTEHTPILYPEALGNFFNNENQVIGQGMFTKGQNQVHTYTLKIFFDETGEEQIQESSFAAHLVIDSINENSDVVITGDQNLFVDTSITKNKAVTKTFKVTSNLNAEQEYKVNLKVINAGTDGDTNLKYTLTSINEGNDGTTMSEIKSTEIEPKNFDPENPSLITLGTGTLASKNSIHSYTLTFTGNEDSVNYLFAKVEVKKNLPELKTLILGTNNQNVLSDKPTLTTSFDESGDKAGLYSSTDTNSGNPTYFFRGNVENNNVKFAGLNWKIIRINEDGSIRLILQEGINNNQEYYYHPEYQSDYGGSINSSTVVKYYLDGSSIGNSETTVNLLHQWYDEKLSSYSSNIKTTDFCQTQIKFNNDIATYKCSSEDTFNETIALLNIYEAVHMGFYSELTSNKVFISFEKSVLLNHSFTTGDVIIQNFLYNNSLTATSYYHRNIEHTSKFNLNPVISLKSDVMATGDGTVSNPYVIED